MDSRELLLKVLNGGMARQARLEVVATCKGAKRLESTLEFDGDFDISITVVCNNFKQLDLQSHEEPAEGGKEP